MKVENPTIFRQFNKYNDFSDNLCGLPESKIHNLKFIIHN